MNQVDGLAFRLALKWSVWWAEKNVGKAVSETIEDHIAHGADALLNTSHKA